MKKLIYLLMTLMGFGAVSCESPVEDTMAEYGCPYVNFNLKARVIDQTGKPIEGIKTHSGMFVTYSDQAGNVIANGQVFPGDQYMVTFEDVDGEENGGEFETLVLDITDKVEKVGVGSGSWHDGDYTAELGDVTMILKEK